MRAAIYRVYVLLIVSIRLEFISLTYLRNTFCFWFVFGSRVAQYVFLLGCIVCYCGTVTMRVAMYSGYVLLLVEDWNLFPRIIATFVLFAFESKQLRL